MLTDFIKIVTRIFHTQIQLVKGAYWTCLSLCIASGKHNKFFLGSKKKFESGPFFRIFFSPFFRTKMINLGAFSSVFDVESDGDLFCALQCPKSPLKSVFCFVFIRDR